ncbi:unnamed protein product [Withania somnifera]
MDQGGVVSFRQRQSPSSDRFLGVFSPPQSDSAIFGGNASVSGDELNEDEVFWTGDFTEPPQRHSTSPSSNTRRKNFRQPEKFGILAALPEDHLKLNRPLVYRKPSITLTSSPATKNLFHSPPISSSPSSAMRAFPTIPKSPLDREHSYKPVRKFQNSAPVNVPMMQKKAVRTGELADVEIDDDDEMLPPHEIVARGSTRSPKTTFSVLEGAGRTLKGRDLRRVRNAVFRQTGFLD